VKPYKNKVCYRTPTAEEKEQDKSYAAAEAKLSEKVDKIVKHLDNNVDVLGEPHNSEMKIVLDANRAILKTISSWIDPETYKNSRSQYGIPDYILDLMDKDVGPEVTTADVLTYVAKAKLKMQLNQRINYLELGISVGKTFVQVGNVGDSGTLATIDLEKPTPVLLGLFDDANMQSSWRYYFIGSAPRKDNDTFTTYTAKIGGHSNQVLYVSGDVRDEQSWLPLNQAKVRYNIILSDAAHDPASILDEIYYLLRYDLIDHSTFFLLYNALGNDMTKAFAKIFLTLQEKFPVLDEDKNIKLLRVRNWLGTNEGHALNGMISTFDLNQLMFELK